MELPKAHLVPGPTVVPNYLLARYAETHYPSGDLYSECVDTYHEACSRLETLLSFGPEKARGGNITIQSGEGMVGLWGGLKSVIPWPFDQDLQLIQGPSSTKFKILCIGNGLYGCGMAEMIESLRYPNLEIRKVDTAWDQPIDVQKAVKEIEAWEPDLVTAVHCDTPTGVLNSAAVEAIGAACEGKKTLYYVDVVSSTGAVPVDIAGWNIDIGLLGSQKAFSCEPSLAIVTVSSKAWKQIEKVNYTGYDALLPFKSISFATGFPYTPLWSALDALNVQLKTIFGDVGQEKQKTLAVYERHETVAKYCRDQIKDMGLELWWGGASEDMNSASVTAVRVPNYTTWEVLDAKLRQKGVVFGGSYGQTSNALFRVGHMGTQANLETITFAMDVLREVIKSL